MKLEEIQESWSSDSQIDDTELDNESLKIPELHHKYFRIFSDEKLKLVRMYSKQKELRRLKWLYYTGKLDQETLENLEWHVFDLDIKKNRSDLEMFIESDKDILELSEKIWGKAVRNRGAGVMPRYSQPRVGMPGPPVLGLQCS